jgi:hypothetical protein
MPSSNRYNDENIKLKSEINLLKERLVQLSNEDDLSKQV